MHAEYNILDCLKKKFRSFYHWLRKPKMEILDWK